MHIHYDSKIIWLLTFTLTVTSIVTYAQNSSLAEQSVTTVDQKQFNNLSDAFKELSKATKSNESRINKIEKSQKEKDVWDKISSISGLVSGLLVAIIGGIAANIYRKRQLASEVAKNDREIKVLQIQTIQTFLPHLQSNDKREKEAALIAIAGLDNSQLATKLADLYRDEAAIGALAKLSFSSNDNEAKVAKATLNSVLNDLVATIVTLEKDGDLKGSGVLISSDGLIATTDYMVGEGKEPINVRISDDNIVPATIKFINQNYGVSILKIDGTDFPYIDIDTKTGRLDEDIMAFEYVHESGWSAMKGHIDASNVFLKNVGGKNYSGLLSTTLKVRPGLGGSPVFSTKGQLIGLIHSRSMHKSFLASSTALVEGLDYINHSNKFSGPEGTGHLK